MYRKLAFAAIAAAATIGVSMIAPTSASAAPGFHGNGGVHAGRIIPGARPMRVNARFGHPGRFMPRPRPNPHPWWRHFRFGCGYYRARYGHYQSHCGHYRLPVGYVAAPVATYAVARPVAADPCSCLTKEYTPDGRVLFKDVCTNEAAINPPLEAPQQTGMIPPQPEQ